MISDEIREQRKKLKGQGVKAHLQYFWEYYKAPFFIIVIAVIVAIYLIHYFTAKKEQVFGITFLNAEVSESDPDVGTNFQNQLASDLGKALHINSRKEEVTVDTSRYQSVGTRYHQETDLSVQTAIISSISSGNTDAAVMDAWNFKKYAEGGAFLDLRKVFSDETLNALSDKIYYIDATEIGNEDEEYTDDPKEEDANEVTEDQAASEESISNFTLPDPSSMKEPVPIGILVNDMPYISKAGIYQKSAAILGVGGKTEHKGSVRTLLKILQE